MLTPQEKVNRLEELANIIAINREPETNEIPVMMKHFSLGVLLGIEECEESWCDTCPLRKEVGMLCNEWLEEVSDNQYYKYINNVASVSEPTKKPSVSEA